MKKNLLLMLCLIGTLFAQTIFGTASAVAATKVAPSFTLVDADTDLDIGTIQDGDTIYLYPGDDINIRFNPSLNPESVRFWVNDDPFSIENEAPFALAGDDNGDYNPWTTVETGWYTVTVGQYTGNNATGTNLGYEWVYFYVKKFTTPPQPPIVNAGPDQNLNSPTSSTTLMGSASDPDGSIASVNWSFVSGPVTPNIVSPNSNNTSVTGMTALGSYRFRFRATDNTGLQSTDDVLVTVRPTVTSFTLINANTDTDIMTINNGTVIDRASLPTLNLNIRANTSPSVVGSVRFQYDASFDRYENDPPYAMFGDVNGNYNAGNLTLGNHTLRGTASTGANGTGIVGPTRTVNFSVINSNARLSADAEASAEKAIKCFPNPSTDRFTVNLACKSSGSGTVAVYDEAGKLTKTLFEGSVSEGQMLDLNWDASDANPGIYILKVNVGNTAEVEKLVLK